MLYIIFPDLYIIFCFINLIIKYFKNVFITYFAISSIVVYNIIIIPDVLNKINNNIELEIVKYWLI